MTFEEMMQEEEAKFLTEQEAWKRLHENISKELFDTIENQMLAQELGVGQS